VSRVSLSVGTGVGEHRAEGGRPALPQRAPRLSGLVATVLILLGVVLLIAGVADASVVRSCGTIPESSRHLAISNVTTRGLACTTARRDAVVLFGCSSRSCRAGGRRFTCRNLGSGEAVDERCVSGTVVVRFQTGV